MLLSPDFFNSLNENLISTDGCWAWSSEDVYSIGYKELLSQPINLNTVSLDYFRFKSPITEITIRYGITSASPLIFNGLSYNISEFDDVQEEIVGFSVGCSDPYLKDIVDLGNGTCNVSACNVYLLDNPDGRGFVSNYSLTSVNLSVPDNVESYVCAKYNNGNPIIYLETNKNNINESDISCLQILWRVGSIIHSISRGNKGLNLSNKIAKSILNTKPYSKSIDGGLVISESSTPTNRTVLVTSAVVYSGIVPVNVLPFNSSTDKLTLAYHSSGVWNYSSSATVYNNTQYDDGTNLQTIPNNKYAVRYFYRSIGDIKETFYVLCNTYHNNIEDAKLDGPRSDIPILLRDHCVLIGRIIVQYNASNGYVENINDQNFIPTQVSNHNDLANIQGGSISSYYHVSATTFGYLSGVSADIQEQINSKVDFSVISAGLMDPTGFPRIDNTTISFNNSTRSFNISGIEPWNVYYRGNKFTKTSESIQIPNLSGLHFIYFTSAGTLTTSQIQWDILTTIQISIVYWDGTKAIYFADERHGCIMDGMTHKYNHLANWTKYINGFNATYTIGNDSSAYFGVANGMIADEDIFLTISQGSSGNYFTQQINFPGYFPVYYRSGVDGNGTWKKDVSTIYPYKGTSGGYVNYNSLTGGIWGQTQLTVGNYGAFFIYATNNMWEPIICVQSQRNDANLLDAQTYNTPSTLRFDDLPFQEAKLLYRIIVRTNASYTGNPFKLRIEEVTDYRSDTAIINAAAGGTGTVTSVALTAPSDFQVIGSPITLAGTLGLTYSNQTPNTFLAGPISGSASTPSFRNLTSSDIPDISNRYLPLSGGSLTGQLKGTTISASGNISATNFVGNLTGYKNIDNTNEITIANGYSSTGVVWFNYRGTTSAITEYRLGSGKSDGSYAAIRANSYIVSGGNSNQFLKGDGSLDSTSYTSLTITSGISGNLQNQITNNNNSLSAYLPLSGGTLTGDLKVSAPFTYNFGDSFNKFYNSYFYNIDTTNISAYNSYISQQIISSNIKPETSFVVDIGTTTNRFKDLYIKNITSNALTTTDTSVTNKFKTIFGTTDTSASTTPHIHFEPRSLAINTSGDMYFDGLRLQLNDKNNVQNTIAYTTDLSAYQSVSGLSNQLSGYYRTSGGPIFGSISASGNITGNQFNGNLNGYKNVDNGNECTISNGFASGNILYINYRGATSAINEYRFCKGQTSATYSDLRANSFIKNGGTSSQFLKADGTVDSNTYQTISAFSQTISGYLPLSGGILTGNLIVKEAFIGTSAVSDTAYFGHKLKIGNYPAITQTFQGITTIDSDVDAYYNGLNLNVKGVPQLLLNGTSIDAYSSITAPAFYKNGGSSDQFLMADGSVSYADSLKTKFLPLSGGYMTGQIQTSSSISFKDSSNTEQILISGGVISFGSDIPKLNLSKIIDGSYERLDLSTNNHPTTRASLNASGYIRCQKGLGLNGNDTYLTSVPELTGSRSSGSALTNLIEILKNYGLIIDNTTA